MDLLVNFIRIEINILNEIIARKITVYLISLNTMCDLSNPVVEANDWPQLELCLNFSKNPIKPPTYTSIFALEVRPKASTKISVRDLIESNFKQTCSVEV